MTAANATSLRLNKSLPTLAKEHDRDVLDKEPDDKEPEGETTHPDFMLQLTMFEDRNVTLLCIVIFRREVDSCGATGD